MAASYHGFAEVVGVVAWHSGCGLNHELMTVPPLMRTRTKKRPGRKAPGVVGLR
jgi:hypothetical protein